MDVTDVASTSCGEHHLPRPAPGPRHGVPRLHLPLPTTSSPRSSSTPSVQRSRGPLPSRGARPSTGTLIALYMMRLRVHSSRRGRPYGLAARHAARAGRGAGSVIGPQQRSLCNVAAAAAAAAAAASVSDAISAAEGGSAGRCAAAAAGCAAGLAAQAEKGARRRYALAEAAVPERFERARCACRDRRRPLRNTRAGVEATGRAGPGTGHSERVGCRERGAGRDGDRGRVR